MHLTPSPSHIPGQRLFVAISSVPFTLVVAIAITITFAITAT
ncbi:MAG TPA: hypothetical protein VGU46_06080 [Acidobacteriaceae bacterium]|nr:hypothetical protein [Acidobacteriaceae bacterium]